MSEAIIREALVLIFSSMIRAQASRRETPHHQCIFRLYQALCSNELLSNLQSNSIVTSSMVLSLPRPAVLYYPATAFYVILWISIINMGLLFSIQFLAKMKIRVCSFRHPYLSESLQEQIKITGLTASVWLQFMGLMVMPSRLGLISNLESCGSETCSPRLFLKSVL